MHIKTIDGIGFFFERIIALTLLFFNLTPTLIARPNTLIAEDMATYSTIGSISRNEQLALSFYDINEVPVINVPGPQNGTEDTPLTFNTANGNPISITDGDNDNQSITIAVTNGIFYLSTTSGLTGSGNGSSSLSYSGTLADINTALNNSYFISPFNYNGSASVAITTDDGTGGIDAETIGITIAAVNDPPLIRLCPVQQK